ncbi:substance-P receptor-like [Paramacrobiotus metropolitanus]|uniref:substance-P receptor-like n=1 Tax=Paramacrobiotus metropolitanus TaxID=2943436 RepID=UPI002445E586|nr:substance-P receptor-like [Paramacrobiotus metropolitanus]
MNATVHNITTNVFVASSVQWTAVWSFSIVLQLTFFIVLIILNMFMLLFFIRHRTLRTGFSVYLLVLLAANIFFAVGKYTVEILHSLYRHWWMSRAVCSFYLYHSWVFVGVQLHMHFLITINRLWALTFPLSYRNRHSSAIAWLLSAGIVAYVHMTPEFGCYLDTAKQGLYAAVVNQLAFTLPAVVVVASYPYILYKYLRRRRTNNMRVTAATSPRQQTGDNVHPFLILTLLTGSILICWMPSQIYWTLYTVMDVSNLSLLFQSATVLLALQGVLDPILFALALRSVRLALLKLCQKRAT